MKTSDCLKYQKQMNGFWLHLISTLFHWRHSFSCIHSLVSCIDRIESSILKESFHSNDSIESFKILLFIHTFTLSINRIFEWMKMNEWVWNVFKSLKVQVILNLPVKPFLKGQSFERVALNLWRLDFDWLKSMISLFSIDDVWMMYAFVWSVGHLLSDSRHNHQPNLTLTHSIEMIDHHLNIHHHSMTLNCHQWYCLF